MKKVYLETFGCQMNVSDSERVATLLESDGYEITPHEESADVILFNTCSVREKAENKLYSRVGQVRKSNSQNPIIGVMGCVAQLEGETLFGRNSGIDFVVGTKAVGRVNQAITDVFKGKTEYFDLGTRETDYDWSVSKTQRNSPYIGFVPIIEGCNKFCSYCIVPFSRGREKSLTASEVISNVIKLKDEGVSEIHLIGQNVNSYRPKSNEGLENIEGATSFSKLLRAVAKTGIERIKFNTSFPRDFHPDIVEAIEDNENLCNWVHLPVQSGSNNVLKLMRRGHTIENYFKKIDAIKNSRKQIAVTTDIIVGYPGETEQDFLDSVKMVEYCKFDGAYIFKYSPRPGTPAFELGDTVSLKEKTERFRFLESVQKNLQQKIYQDYVGKQVKVLVEKKSTKSEKALSGHSTCHKVVNFIGNENLLGKIVNVEISEIKNNSLFGVEN